MGQSLVSILFTFIPADSTQLSCASSSLFHYFHFYTLLFRVQECIKIVSSPIQFKSNEIGLLVVQLNGSVWF
jgi:hypothetical protein